MKIANCPNEAWDYEFIVVYSLSDDFSYYGHTANSFEAEQMAQEIKSGLIIHNVRIQGHKEPPKKKKMYTLFGSWEWSCVATSREEAIEKFDNADISELNIEFSEDNIEEEDA